MYLIIDIGNTRVKIGVFHDNELLERVVFKKTKIISEVKSLVKQYQIELGIISSVGKLSNSKLESLKRIVNIKELNHKLKFPFKNLYATPTTLGVDRIAHAAAAVNKFPNQNVLVIDSGTCLTYDFINDKKEYLGGAISLGLQLRFNALHDFTANLPLLKPVTSFKYIGDSTDNSIFSGVINGICHEMNGVINQYRKDYKDLTVVLTGGDSEFLAKQLKNGIFAIPNFVLEGLYTILIHNLDND